MAATYVPKKQYTRWTSHAEELGMSISEFIKCMVEAGNKKFDATVDPDETVHELREQRNHYKKEFERLQSRVDKLEDRLNQGEKAEIRRYVAENPGATFAEIHQHLIETVPERANRSLEELEGDELQVQADSYYVADEASVGDV